LIAVSAALIWVVRAYVAFYGFVGLFLLVLIVAVRSARAWSTIVERWRDVPTRFSAVLARTSSAGVVRWEPRRARRVVDVRLQQAPVPTRR
jgi:hypothetical protein